MTTKLVRWLIALALCGCTAQRGPEHVAPPRGALGEEERAEHQRAFADGLTLFRDAEQAGFDAARCEQLREHFEALAGAPAAYMRGLSAARCGDAETATAAYREALRRDEALCAPRVQLALVELAHGQTGHARAGFEQAVRRDPRCAEGYVNLAALQRERGALEDAKRNVRRALAIEARLLPAFNELALLHLAEAGDDGQKLDLAEVVCSQAQKIDDGFAPIYNSWGLIDLRRGRITDAAAKFRKALSLDPSMFAAHMNYGRIALSYRAYDDARQAFEQALSLRDDDFDALIGLGVAMRGLGKLEQAQARYAQARKTQPRRPEPDFNLGVLYQDFRSGSREDMQTARRHFGLFLDKARALGGYDDAIAEVTRRCEQRPGRRRGRRTCMVGRLQTIEQYLEATEETAN